MAVAIAAQAVLTGAAAVATAAPADPRAAAQAPRREILVRHDLTPEAAIHGLLAQAEILAHLPRVDLHLVLDTTVTQVLLHPAGHRLVTPEIPVLLEAGLRIREIRARVEHLLVTPEIPPHLEAVLHTREIPAWAEHRLRPETRRQGPILELLKREHHIRREILRIGTLQIAIRQYEILDHLDRKMSVALIPQEADQ
ncbi:MAG: hypothetical protein ABJA67_10850 [Chthonomonadales bacterium]